MHLKAIQIKEKILGPDDYEVGLSVGHLASLYNYHMEEYQKAEQLYYRSIKISKKNSIRTIQKIFLNYSILNLSRCRFEIIFGIVLRPGI